MNNWFILNFQGKKIILISDIMSLNWKQFEAKFEGRVNEKFEELAYI